jgi:hypothetical protein
VCADSTCSRGCSPQLCSASRVPGPISSRWGLCLTFPVPSQVLLALSVPRRHVTLPPPYPRDGRMGDGTGLRIRPDGSDLIRCCYTEGISRELSIATRCYIRHATDESRNGVVPGPDNDLVRSAPTVMWTDEKAIRKHIAGELWRENALKHLDSARPHDGYNRS